MKNFFCFLLILAFLSPQAVFAAPASNVAGQYYYTDIKTYFFGAPITSYNLGGKTAIVCEDLNWHYNHDVYWLEDERKLTVDKKDNVEFTSLQAQAGQTLKTQDGITGKAVGDILRTDIKTYLNGRPIDSYNIGGQTVIICEDMRDYGYDVEWNESSRSLFVTGNDSNFKTEADIGTVTELSDGSGIGGASATVDISRLELDGHPVVVEPQYSLKSVYSPTVWVPLAPTLEALGASWEWDAASNKFTVTSFDPSKIETAEPLEREFVSPIGNANYGIALSLYSNDREIQMTETVIVGHMQNMHEETFTLNAVVYEGIVYAPLAAIVDCLGLEVVEGGDSLVTPE